MGKAAPLVNHAQKPGVKPVCPVRIVGRNRTSQGAYMVLSVPFVVALEEIFIYRIIILDIIRLQKIPYILDAHPDVSELHLQRHALLHSRIYGLETIPTLLLRHVFHEFHHRVVSEVIFTFQQLHHAHDILANAVLVNFLSFFRSIGTRIHLLIIFRVESLVLRVHVAVNFHCYRLTVEIRFRIERHHKTVVHRRLKRQVCARFYRRFWPVCEHRSLGNRLIYRQNLLVSDAVQSFGIRFVGRQRIIFIAEFHQYDNRLTISTFQRSKGRRQHGNRALHALHAVCICDVSEFQHQDTVARLHLQVVVFVFGEFCSGVDVHPCWHILVVFVAAFHIGHVFAEMGNSKSAVIFCDTLQQLLHRLGADEELLLVVCMNDCYLH